MGTASIICAVVGVGMWRDGVEFAWVFTVTMALAAAFFLAGRIPGAFGLRFDDDGFEVTEMFSRRRFAWTRISPVVPRRGLLQQFVEFTHEGGLDGPVHSGLGHADKVRLNDTYGMSAAKLAEIMNARRARALEQARRTVWRGKGGGAR